MRSEPGRHDGIVVLHKLTEQHPPYVVGVPGKEGPPSLLPADYPDIDLTLTRHSRDDHALYSLGDGAALKATIFRPRFSDHPADIFLLGPTYRPSSLRVPSPSAAVSVAFALTPIGVGGLRAEYVFDGEREVRPARTPLSHVDVEIEAPYRSILDWLHDPAVMAGNLIADGYTVRGDLYALSYLEGWVSSGLPQSSGYASGRSRSIMSAYVGALDRIRSVLGQPDR